MPFHSWSVPGRKPGHVDEGQHGDVEGVAGADEPGGLLGGVDVQAAGEVHGLVGDDADRVAVDPAEADDDVRREQRVDLQELAVVEDGFDDLVHVVGLVGESGIRVSSSRSSSVTSRVDLDGVRRAARRSCWAAGRTAAPDVVEGVLLVGGDVVRGARLGHVGVRAAELLHGDVLAGDGLDDVGSGDEHLGGLVDHDDEVGQRGGVDVAAGAAPMISEICGMTPGGEDVARKISA